MLSHCAELGIQIKNTSRSPWAQIYYTTEKPSPFCTRTLILTVEYERNVE
jgi:hypothetical protein